MGTAGGRHGSIFLFVFFCSLSFSFFFFFFSFLTPIVHRQTDSAALCILTTGMCQIGQAPKKRRHRRRDLHIENIENTGRWQDASQETAALRGRDKRKVPWHFMAFCWRCFCRRRTWKTTVEKCIAKARQTRPDDRRIGKYSKRSKAR